MGINNRNISKQSLVIGSFLQSGSIHLYFNIKGQNHDTIDQKTTAANLVV